MIDISQITAFFGWCTVINLSVYALSALFIVVLKDFTISIHSNFMGLNASELPALYFKFLGSFKIIIIVFNVAPYIALKLMS